MFVRHPAMTISLPRCRSLHLIIRSTSQPSPSSTSKPIKYARSCFTRRNLIITPILLTSALQAIPSLAFTPPPAGRDRRMRSVDKSNALGYRLYRDVLDGYEFFVPDSWLPVTSAGNEVAYRDSLHPEQNLFVNISSPSSSKFSSIRDIGSPEDAGNQILRQYLKEFMSTRIGIIREGEFISGSERMTTDGNIYYDIEVLLRSYASRSQLAVTPLERQRAVELEWERRLFTVVGVANKRRYEFRLQADKNVPTTDLVYLSSCQASSTECDSRQSCNSLPSRFDAIMSMTECSGIANGTSAREAVGGITRLQI